MRFVSPSNAKKRSTPSSPISPSSKQRRLHPHGIPLSSWRLCATLCRQKAPVYTTGKYFPEPETAWAML